jgi:hypothetical protein
MPLLNLALVTQTYTTLLDRSITNSPEWNAANVLTVSPLPPDQLTGNHTLGFYLYHLTEDPAFKNPPPVASVDNPDTFRPMGLQLYYVMTAHSDLEDANSPLAEQLMMGLGVKGLRDFAIVDENTQVAGATVFPAGLIGHHNRFRITLTSPPREEAVQYWMAGSQPLRLAAYYEVSPVLLEPEPQTVSPGRVFQLGIRSAIAGNPQLKSCASKVVFQAPGDPAPRSVEADPAEAPVGGQVVFQGSNLAGDSVDLLIRHVSWAQFEVVDPVTWGVTSNASTAFATVQAFAGAQPVLPGVYAAMVRVTTTALRPDGSRQAFSSSSNQVTFSITPLVTLPITFGGGLWTVKGTNFDPLALPDDQIQIFTGSERLTRVPGAPGGGQLQVVDPATMRFAMPAGIEPGSIVNVRILIRGTESAPAWVTTQ